jgi:hypothetical protein
VIAGFRRRFDRIKTALEPWSDDDRTKLQSLLTRLAADLRDAQDRDAAESAGEDSAATIAPDTHEDAPR